MEILKELIEAAFVCISNEREIWDTNEENLTAEDSLSFKQVCIFFFVFLVLFFYAQVLAILNMQ